MGGFSDTENTSHIFGEFTDIDTKIEPKKVWLIFRETDLKNRDFLSNFFQEKDFKKSQKSFVHHIATGWDRIFMIKNPENSLRNSSELFLQNFIKIPDNEENFYENFKIKTENENIFISQNEKSENFLLENHEILACEMEEKDFSCQKIQL